MNTTTDTFETADSEARIKLPVLQQLALVAVILLLIFGTALTPSILLNKQSPEPTNMTPEISVINEKNEATSDAPAFEAVSITGKAAYVWDVQSQKALYKNNESSVLPLASLTKLMTALVAHELLREEDTITINEMALRQDGFSGLSEGETFNQLTLSDLTLISSSNDGAYALAYAAGAVLTQNDPANAFVQAMNIRAEEIGLAQTYFKNPTGLDISTTEGGAYGTARDMAFLMEYIIAEKPEILELTSQKDTTVTNTAGEVHDIENTNFFVDEIPGLIGSKTGYTDLAGGNLVVAFEAGLNRPIVVVVLGSTRQQRFNDVIALVKETQTYFKQQ